jgi:hypothetical protein
MAFRRERTQLTDLIERAKQILLPIGHKWHEQDKMFRGPKGGRLRFTYLENDSDADAYQGHSYTRVYAEELGTFPSEAPVLKMWATLRSGNGVPCQLKSTFNPGGPGHSWVKARYRLDSHPQGLEVFRFSFVNPFTKKAVEKTRIFIPSRITDNKFLGDEYVANLAMVGSKELVRAWLEGDWSIIEGAYFNEWDPDRHIIKPFAIPAGWLRFRAMDWGSAAPFSVGWYAVASDDYECSSTVIIPRGALVRYREWYGQIPGQLNRGLKLDAETVARGIIERTPEGEHISYTVLDPSAFAEAGGPSIAERMAKATDAAFWPTRADNRRVARHGAIGGWDQLRARLVGQNGRPMLYVFSTGINLIRTLPALQHDSVNAEDLDTEGEDHAADELRYAVMSRPWIKDREPLKTDILDEMIKPRSLNDFMREHFEEHGLEEEYVELN